MNCDFYTRSQWRNLNWCHMRPSGRICQRFRDVLLMQAMLYFCWQAEKIACDKYIDYDVLNQWSASKATPRCASVSCQLSLFRHSESERSRHAVKQHLLGKYWKYSSGLTDFSVVFFSSSCSLQVWSDHVCVEPTRPRPPSWPSWTATARSTPIGCSRWSRESRRYGPTGSQSAFIHTLQLDTWYTQLTHTLAHTHLFSSSGDFAPFSGGDFIGCDVIGWHRL